MGKPSDDHRRRDWVANTVPILESPNRADRRAEKKAKARGTVVRVVTKQGRPING